MAPRKALPYPDDFATADAYIDSLLNFATTSAIFQTLCGGVHILDFFTREPSLYHKVLPAEWRPWLLACPSMKLLDLLIRDDLDIPRDDSPPESLIEYIKNIRKHSLIRTLPEFCEKPTKLPRHVAVGMIPKKIHEVANFAKYVDGIAEEISSESGKPITHFVDFGSGQNYLGRTLASPPYNKHIVAVESREINITGSKAKDVLAGVAEREKVMRNKKVFRQRESALTKEEKLNAKEKRRMGKNEEVAVEGEPDLRPVRELATIYTAGEGKGYVQYVEHRVQDGDLTDVVAKIERLKIDAATTGELNIISDASSVTNPSAETVLEEIQTDEEIRLMAISIHSCGNLSHHGIRSLLLNPTVHAIAIVGCCYNLLSERLSGPSYKHPLLRPNLRSINQLSSVASIASNDPHGFPMSSLLSTCNSNEGIPLNITARMMAVQAPSNWTAKESDDFFKRHFYRALLQKLFLDKGVVEKTTPPPRPSDTCCPGEGEEETKEEEIGCIAPESTTPIIIGSLRKPLYATFTSYVRGAIAKLSLPNALRGDLTPLLSAKLSSLSDDEIAAYEARYKEKKKELSVMWSLMAFSAGVVESLIVVDRYAFLREGVQRGELREAWVEAVFEYGLSPRNLVVVGIK